jgi:hypothetical protein
MWSVRRVRSEAARLTSCGYAAPALAYPTDPRPSRIYENPIQRVQTPGLWIEEKYGRAAIEKSLERGRRPIAPDLEADHSK